MRARGLLLTAVLAVGVLSPTAARADSAAVNGSWYWADQPAPIPGSGPVPAVGQPAGNLTPPNVPAGDFAVAEHNSASNKETYLHVDTSAIATGSTVSNFVLTLTEDPSSLGSQAADGLIVALPATDFFADGAEARPYGERPSHVDKPAIAGKRSTTGVWTFDISPIVNSWLSGSLSNNGLAMVGTSGNFEVVWAGSNSSAGKPTAMGDVSAGGGSAGSGSSSGSISSAPSSSSGAAPVDTSSSSGAAPPFLSVGSPTPASPLPTTVTTVAKNTARPKLRRAASSHGAPPLGFFIIALGVVALAGSSMVALGDAGEPRPRRQGTVLRTLERRAALASKE